MSLFQIEKTSPCVYTFWTEHLKSFVGRYLHRDGIYLEQLCNERLVLLLPSNLLAPNANHPRRDLLPTRVCYVGVPTLFLLAPILPLLYANAPLISEDRAQSSRNRDL